MSGKKVVVTTKHRGVFFGTMVERNGTNCVLGDARVVVYWSRETKGFIGLASAGPLGDSRVSGATPRLELFDVTAILDCTPEATERWEAGPWS